MSINGFPKILFTMTLVLGTGSCAGLFSGSMLTGYELRLLNWTEPEVFFQIHSEDPWRRLDGSTKEGLLTVFRETRSPGRMPGRIKIVDRESVVYLDAYRGEDGRKTCFRAEGDNVNIERDLVSLDMDSFLSGISSTEVVNGLAVTVLTISQKSIDD